MAEREIDLDNWRPSDVWPQLSSKAREVHIVSGGVFRLGTLQEAIGHRAAEALLAQPDPFDDARESAALILRGLPPIE